MSERITVHPQGKVIYKNTHTREIWTLEVMETDLYTLPGQPVQADLQQAIPPGATVTLVSTSIWPTARCNNKYDNIASIILASRPCESTARTLRAVGLCSKPRGMFGSGTLPGNGATMMLHWLRWSLSIFEHGWLSSLEKPPSCRINTSVLCAGIHP